MWSRYLLKIKKDKVTLEVYIILITKKKINKKIETNCLKGKGKIKIILKLFGIIYLKIFLNVLKIIQQFKFVLKKKN